MSTTSKLRLHIHLSEDLAPTHTSLQRAELCVVPTTWKFVSDVADHIVKHRGLEAPIRLVLDGTPLQPTTPIEGLRDSDHLWVYKLCDGVLPTPAPSDRPWCEGCGTCNPFELSGAQQRLLQAGVKARCRECTFEALGGGRFSEGEQEEEKAAAATAKGGAAAAPPGWAPGEVREETKKKEARASGVGSTGKGTSKAKAGGAFKGKPSGSTGAGGTPPHVYV